jgi:hypothetical protein
MLTVQNKRRSGTHIKLWLEISNMAETNIHRLAVFETLEGDFQVFPRRAKENTLHRSAFQQGLEFRIGTWM